MNSSFQNPNVHPPQLSSPRWGILFLIIIAHFIAAPPAFSAWQATLQVSIPDPAADSGMATSTLTFGMNPESSDDFDNPWDTVALDSTALNLHFDHAEYAAEKAKLWKDLRSETLPKEWDVEVSSPLSGKTRITWDAGAVPANIALQLLDPQSRISIDMKSPGSYSFANPPSSTRKFTIRASEKTVTDGSLAGGSAGGGCGFIKDAGRKDPSASHPGTAALYMALLLTPLIWLAIRKTVFAGAVNYRESGKFYSRNPVSLTLMPHDPVVHRLRWRWRV